MTNRQTPVLVKGLSSGIVAIAAGGDSTCALTKDGRVKCWGLNDEGQLGIGTMQQQRNAPVLVGAITGGIKAIAVGYNLGCALRTDGGVMCWGYNNHGQLGDGTTTTRRTPVAVKGITGVISIGVGGSQTCALISSGVAKCWGYNLSGEVGNGTWADSHLPVLVRNF